MKSVQYSVVCLLLVEITSSAELIHNLQCDPCTCTSSNIRRFNGFMFQTDADCSNRNLKTIPDRLPESIVELNLDHNTIQPKELLKVKRFKKLKKLSLAHNQLRTLPPGLFHSSDFLQKLDLQGNVIDKINDTTFHPLHNLQEIKGLELNTSPRGLFENLTNLSFLDIKFHQEEIPEDIFDTLMLQKIRLSLVNARNIPENLFHFGPKSLRSIAIDGPQLTDVSESLFDNLEVLNELDLKVSRVQSLPERLFGSTSDTSGKAVNLVKIQIEGVLALPSFLFQSQQSLSSVILRKLKYLPQKLFNHLETLRELEYSTSAIYSLPNDYFLSLKGLQYLNLSNNNLEYLDEEVFSHLKSLYVLDLSYNNIRNLPDKLLSNLGMLSYLNLRNNELVKISNELFKFKYTIETLDLSDNFISIIEANAFNDLIGLQKLTLAKNKITHLAENIFQKARHIKILNLSKNAIKELPDKLLFSFDKLEAFDISYNRIKYMPDEFFPQPWYLVITDFTGNSFECDCNLLIVVYTLVFLRVSLMGDICTTPLPYAGRSARDIRLSDICGQKKAFDFYIKFGIDPTSIVPSLESSYLDLTHIGDNFDTLMTLNQDEKQSGFIHQEKVKQEDRVSWSYSVIVKEILPSKVNLMSSSQFLLQSFDSFASSDQIDGSVSETIKIASITPHGGLTPIVLHASPQHTSDQLVSMPATPTHQSKDKKIDLKGNPETETDFLTTDFRAIIPTAGTVGIHSQSQFSSIYSTTPHLPGIDSHDVEIFPELSGSGLLEEQKSQQVERSTSHSISTFSSHLSIANSTLTISSGTVPLSTEFLTDIIQISTVQDMHGSLHRSTEIKHSLDKPDTFYHTKDHVNDAIYRETDDDPFHFESVDVIPSDYVMATSASLEADHRPTMQLPTLSKHIVEVTSKLYNDLESIQKEQRVHKTLSKGISEQIVTSATFVTQINSMEIPNLDKDTNFLMSSEVIKVLPEESDKIYTTTSYHVTDYFGISHDKDFGKLNPGEEKAHDVYQATVETLEFQIPIGLFAALVIFALVMASVMKFRTWYRARTYQVTE